MFARDIIFIAPFHTSARVRRANYRSSEPENTLYCISSFRILACCCFYFPTTMVLMYCYGSAFHVNKLRLKRVVCVNTPEVVSGGHIERVSQVYFALWISCESMSSPFNNNWQSRHVKHKIETTWLSMIGNVWKKIVTHRTTGTIQIKHHLLSFMLRS